MKRIALKAAGLLALLAASAALPSLALAQPTDAKAAEPAKEVLKVGSKAPAIKVDKWVKGEAVEKFDSDHVYVVEFWATWCPPCKKSIPHLGELAQKYKDKNVKIVGVSVWEDNVPAKGGQTYAQRVDEFANKGPLSSKMTYNVAYDGDKGEMAKTWMRAAEQDGIPAAFVVDKTQHIAWIGNPLDTKGLENAIESCVNGTFDIKAAEQKAKKSAEAREKAEEIGPQWQTAMQSEDIDSAMKYADQLLELDADQFGRVGLITFQLALTKDSTKAYGYASKLADGALKDDAENLNGIAWMIVDPEHQVATPDADVALKVATRAVEASKGQEPAILDTQARAYFVKGDVAKAIEVQQKVVELSTDEAKTDAQKVLEEYKAKSAK